MSEEISKVAKKRMSLLGCGWLGFPLAQRLQQLPITSVVKGSTTSAAKLDLFAQTGIEGYLIDLNAEPDGALLETFLDADVLIIAIPPRMGKHEPGHYPALMHKVAEAIRKSPVSEIAFVSSTSIYPDLNRVVVEADVTGPSQSISPDMVEAENIIESLRPEKTVAILRYSGLLGYTRIPGKYVKGQKDMTTGNIPVNYIHRDDAAGALAAMVEQGIVNGTFNMVAPLHPPRREAYERSCAQFGWEAPTYVEAQPPFKIVSGEKFGAHYRYTFKYPDPLEFHYQLEE